jgi:hypothetical protein
MLRATAVEENCMPAELACRSRSGQRLSQLEHKGLNLRDDSKRAGRRDIAQDCSKKFS